ncbi:phosphate/phosphite/phosphonate ABC transporters, periplasmic binding protein [Shimia thalassica]|uniref:Phosphate/phosphite/phosphonate ABC transporters, periplasmic binding protein n=1 Tax=Shimia thalassica TaxID=1715693 RepID=A0A0P1IAH2_9RHOB|nr:PhnD/SsuA/transferrin family substrate-binding protein [Shimia thalassica]CUK01636.1 phosphate/phosphite/phosphonate ABC transporters, periplasmic binding protein [Shimia thalassica]
MIAMLGMYDRPETAASNDRLWQAIRDHLGYGPSKLTRDCDFWEIWESPDLLFAQTCGMPYRTRLHRQVQLVGTPDYGLPDCPAGHYYSVFVTHVDVSQATLADLCEGTFAYNEPVSQSGWAAPQYHLAKMGLAPGKKIQSGAHYLSARAVAEKQADFASLDALTWELIQRYDDFAKSLHVVARTTPTPTLPYITGPRQNATEIRTAVAKAIADLSLKDRAILGLQQLVEIPASAYLAVPSPPPPV